MKTLLKTSLALSLLATTNLMATSYFTTVGNWGGPADDGTWQDSVGNPASGVDYTSGANSFVFQETSVQGASNERYYLDNATGATNWNTQGITFEKNAVMELRNAQGATFNGGDITVANDATGNNAAEIRLVQTHSGDNNTLNGGLFGDAKLQLGSSRLIFHHALQGVTQLDLEVFGDGTLSLQYGQGILPEDGSDPTRISTFYFSGISQNFTGQIDANAYNGIITIDSGNGALNTTFVLGRGAGDRDARLQISGNTSVGDVKAENITLADGVYTQEKMETDYAELAHHFIFEDADSKLYVGMVAVPEPSTSALFGLAGLTLLARRRR